MLKILAINRIDSQISEIPPENIKTIDLLSKDFIYVFDFFSPTNEEVKLLEEFFKFHPLTIEDCVNEVHFSKIDNYDEYLYLVIYCSSSSKSSDVSNSVITKDFCEVDIFLSKNYLLIYRYEQSNVIDNFFDRLKKIKIAHKNCDMLLYELLKECTTQYFLILESFGRDIEQIENVMYPQSEDKKKNPTEIIQKLRQRLVRMRSIIAPEREVVNKLSRDEFAVISKATRKYFRDIYDHLYRITETIDAYRDITTNIMETHLVNISNKLNNIMKTLTIISTVILPLSFVASVYGMNFEYMPELKWKYGYYSVLFVMFTIAFVMIFIFKKKKWF